MTDPAAAAVYKLPSKPITPCAQPLPGTVCASPVSGAGEDFWSNGVQDMNTSLKVRGRVRAAVQDQ